MLSNPFGPIAIATSLMLCNALAIVASPITWTFSNVKLADGSSVTGSFTFDADVPAPGTGLTQFRIMVGGGNIMPAYVYTPSNPLTQLLVYSYHTSTGKAVEVINAFGRNPSGSLPALELLYLDPASFLSDKGGTVPIDLTLSSGQLSNGEIAYETVGVIDGSLIGVPSSAVPEPRAVLLIVLGLAVAVISRFSAFQHQ